MCRSSNKAIDVQERGLQVNQDAIAIPVGPRSPLQPARAAITRPGLAFGGKTCGRHESACASSPRSPRLLCFRLAKADLTGDSTWVEAVRFGSGA